MGTYAVRRLAAASLLFALIVVLQMTGLGFINVGVVYVTVMCIPVIVGTLLMGLRIGLLLGAAFGGFSFWLALRAISPLEAPILEASVLYILVLCFLPRLMIPVLTHAVAAAFRRRGSVVSTGLAAVAGSMTNTVLYLGIVLLSYMAIGLDHSALLGAIGSIILFAGLPEAAAAALIAVPVIAALRKSGLASQLAQAPAEGRMP